MLDFLPFFLLQSKAGSRQEAHPLTHAFTCYTCSPGGPLPFWRQRQCPSSAGRLWWQTWWEVALAFPTLLFFHLAVLWSWRSALTARTFLLLSTPYARSLSAQGKRERGWPKGPGPCTKFLPLSMQGGSITARLASPLRGGWERGQSRSSAQAAPNTARLYLHRLPLLAYYLVCAQTHTHARTLEHTHTHTDFLCKGGGFTKVSKLYQQAVHKHKCITSTFACSGLCDWMWAFVILFVCVCLCMFVRWMGAQQEIHWCFKFSSD